MRIHIFKNGTGVIHGGDPRRLFCDCKVTLNIGGAFTEVTPTGVPAPALTDGIHTAVASTADKEYILGSYTVRGGVIIPSGKYSTNEIKLMHRCDELENKLDEITERVYKLEHEFDTDSLNFIIKDE